MNWMVTGLISVTLVAMLILISFALEENDVDYREETTTRLWRSKLPIRLRLCGNHLSNALAAVCNKGYNVKDGVFSLGFHLGARRSVGANEKAAIWSRQITRRVSRGQQGIVEECCRRGCTTADLRSYCYTEDDEDEVIANEN